MALDLDHLPDVIGEVARELLGEPNRRMSSKSELRYGSNGSLSVDLTKGTFFDHEAQQGGGVLDLITRETGFKGADREHWIGERFRDLIVEERELRKSSNGKGGAPLGREVAWFNYVDESGTFLFQVVKFEPKTFRQRHRDGDKWVWGARGIRQVPYHLPELVEAVSLGHLVFVVEGEKDVDALRKLGIDATTNAGGVGKWSDALDDFFRGADVVVIADNDPQARKKDGTLLFHPDGRPRFPGQDHAREVSQHLAAVAERVRYLDIPTFWPACPKKGDVSDWIASGGTIEQLYDIVEHAPEWSPDIPGPVAENATPTTIQHQNDFIKGFVAPDYLIDGILQRRFIYSMTGQTGHAKTAVALLMARQVGSADPNAMFGNHRVEKGRVIYFVGENPDDVRMRVIGANAVREDDATHDDVWYIPGVFKIADLVPTLIADIKAHGEPVLIIIDTSAAYFFGADEISNTEMGAHARMLRTLTTLPGGPCVLVLCHPIKHAADASQLLPRGGGAFLAEVDGNLTLWRDGDRATLDYGGKLRGPGFQPITFNLEKISNAPTLKDKKGRQITTVHAVPISRKEADSAADADTTEENRVMTAMLANPDGSLATWAEQLGWNVGESRDADGKKVYRIVQKLEKAKRNPLVIKDRNKYALTEKGKEVARKAALAFEQERLRRRGPEPEQLKMGV